MPNDPTFPTPDTAHPIQMLDGSRHEGTVFLSAVVSHGRMSIGDYTYASARTPPQDWAAHLAPYLFDFSPERLIIGKFCQIADGVLFITASANHRYDGISSYPFAIFGGGPKEGRSSMPKPGADTVIGHDVWIGQGVRILPGAQIGNGVIIGAGAVVSGIVPDYVIVGGNPSRTLKRRFSEDTAARLTEIAWWDWPIDKILEYEDFISGVDIDVLMRAQT